MTQIQAEYYSCLRLAHWLRYRDDSKEPQSSPPRTVAHASRVLSLNTNVDIGTKSVHDKQNSNILNQDTNQSSQYGIQNRAKLTLNGKFNTQDLRK